MFIFAIVGMQLFGGTGMSEVSRLHFDNFPAAMTSVLTILLGKYVAIYQAGFECGQGLKIAIFVYSACLVLYLSIVNLFVAILVQAFSSDAEKELEQKASEGSKAPPTGAASDGAPGPPPTSHEELPPPPSWVVRVAWAMVGPPPPHNGQSQDASEPDPLPTDRQVTCCDHADVRPRRLFERLVLLMILVSSLTIAIDVPRLPSDSSTKLLLDSLTHVFTFIFGLELLVKMVAWGPTSYFRDGWNVLDFFIVCTSLLALLVFALPELEFLIALRVLRVLRPLRLLARNEGTRLVMSVLFNCFGIVSAILAVVIFVMTIFGSKLRACRRRRRRLRLLRPSKPSLACSALPSLAHGSCPPHPPPICWFPPPPPCPPPFLLLPLVAMLVAMLAP